MSGGDELIPCGICGQYWHDVKMCPEMHVVCNETIKKLKDRCERTEKIAKDITIVLSAKIEELANHKNA